MSALHNDKCGPCQMLCNCSLACSSYNIQMNVWSLLLEIYRQLNVRYTANMVPNTEHILQFRLSELSSQTYTRYLHFRIFRLRYSTEDSSPAIGGISKIQWELDCKLGVKYSAHPPVYAMCTVAPDIYKVFTAPHSLTTIFNCTWLRSYYRYADIWMRVILQHWCNI
jgi:hypothetical protein